MAVTVKNRKICYHGKVTLVTLLSIYSIHFSYSVCHFLNHSFINSNNKNRKQLKQTSFCRSCDTVTYYMKFSPHVNFAIQKNRENKVTQTMIECRENRMTRKLSDSRYVHNQERPSLLPLKRLQITFFYFSGEFSV